LRNAHSPGGSWWPAGAGSHCSALLPAPHRPTRDHPERARQTLPGLPSAATTWLHKARFSSRGSTPFADQLEPQWQKNAGNERLLRGRNDGRCPSASQTPARCSASFQARPGWSSPPGPGRPRWPLRSWKPRGAWTSNLPNRGPAVADTAVLPSNGTGSLSNWRAIRTSGTTAKLGPPRVTRPVPPKGRYPLIYHPADGHRETTRNMCRPPPPHAGHDPAPPAWPPNPCSCPAARQIENRWARRRPRSSPLRPAALKTLPTIAANGAGRIAPRRWSRGMAGWTPVAPGSGILPARPAAWSPSGRKRPAPLMCPTRCAHRMCPRAARRAALHRSRRLTRIRSA